MTYNEIRALRALGYSDNDIRVSAKNYQGYKFTAATGNNIQTLQIPGTAVVMLGFYLGGTIGNAGDTVTIKLNNETILADVDATGLLGNSNTLFPAGYVEVLRRMTGRDVLTLEYKAASGPITVSPTIVYLTSYTSALRK
jgi:hypothetical protein